jgi:hypothetical protein
MKRMVKLVSLASAIIILNWTASWAGSEAQSNKGASGAKAGNLSYETGEEELRYETGEEELNAVVKVGQTAIIKITRCSNCFFEGFINMGKNMSDVIQLEKIDNQTFKVIGVKPGNCVIDFTDKAQPKMKTRATVNVVAK